MKRLKTRLSIVLAVMMIFTFMPSMAFAADVQDWGSGYKTVTDVNSNPFDTNITFDTSDGELLATPMDDTTKEPAIEAPTDTAWFYDLDSVSFVYGNNNKTLDGMTFSQESFNSLKLKIKISKPSYAYNYTATNPEFVVVDALSGNVTNGEWTGTLFHNYNVTIERSEYKAGSTAEQTVKFSVKSIDAINAVNVSYFSTPDLVGEGIASATVKVSGVTKTPSNANFYLDTVSEDTVWNSSTKTLTGLYDGKAHAIVTDEVPGWAVKYQTYNSKSGKWSDAPSGATVTDVVSGGTKVKAIFTKTGETTVEKEVNVSLSPAAAYVDFDAKASLADGNYTYAVSGSEYNAAEYIAVVANETSIVANWTDAQKATTRAQNAANAAAVEANKATVLEWFNTFYEIKPTTTKAEPNKVTLAIVEKDLTQAERKAATEKYAQLVANFNITPATFVNPSGKRASVYLNTKSGDFEVTFTKAITSKTFKGSKTTKKGKLKKNQTIQFRAEAANGTAVKYKLVNVNTSKISINSTTGKVTLKKGLAKGTYKFKVKAYVPEIKDASEIQNVTVKVKK